MSLKFLLARNESGTRIELVCAEFDEITVGESFDRDPVMCGNAIWTVVKVFDTDEQRKIAALTELVNFNVVKRLFEIRLA